MEGRDIDVVKVNKKNRDIPCFDAVKLKSLQNIQSVYAVFILIEQKQKK